MLRCLVILANFRPFLATFESFRSPIFTKVSFDLQKSFKYKRAGFSKEKPCFMRIYPL